MPEVPNDQAPTREEVLLSPEEKLREEKEALPPQAESPYEQGDVYNFTNPAGEGYSLEIKSVGGDEVEIVNTTVGGEPATVSFEQAELIFANGTKQQKPAPAVEE